MLQCVVAANGPLDKSSGEGSRIGDIKEVSDVHGRGGKAVDDTDRPALLGEPPVPGANIALRIGVQVRVTTVPEEPDVLFIG